VCSTPDTNIHTLFNTVVYFIFGTLVPTSILFLTPWYFFPILYFNTRYPAKRTFVTYTPLPPFRFSNYESQPVRRADSIAVAVNTVDLINSLGPSIDFNNEDLHKAADLITGTAKPNAPKTLSKSAEAAAAHHLVKRFDFQAFSDVMQARNFITNKLIELADNGDPKIELKALELLGKHSDIGLFTERSEITVHHTTSASLENSIKERVKRRKTGNKY